MFTLVESPQGTKDMIFFTYNLYLLPDWTPELSTAILLSPQHWSNLISVSNGMGDKTSKWIRTHLTCLSDGIFVSRSLSIKSHCKSLGNWLKTSKYISPHLHIYITWWHLTYSVSFRKSWGNWTGHRISSHHAFIRRLHLTSSLISVLPHWVNIMTQDIWVHQITPS